MSELRFFSCTFTLLATIAFWVTAIFTLFYGASVTAQYPHHQNPYYALGGGLVLASVASTFLTICVWQAAWESLSRK